MKHTRFRFARLARATDGTHLVPLQLEGLELHGDAVLRGGDHLPHAVLVGRVLFGPARRADGAVQLGEQAAAGRWSGEGGGWETLN